MLQVAFIGDVKILRKRPLFFLFFFDKWDQSSYINTKIKYSETKNNNNKTKIKKSRIKLDAEAGHQSHSWRWVEWSSKTCNQLELASATDWRTITRESLGEGSQIQHHSATPFLSSPRDRWQFPPDRQLTEPYSTEPFGEVFVSSLGHGLKKHL